jgi:STE24 endopeptidase
LSLGPFWILVALALLASIAIGVASPVSRGTDARAAPQIAPADDAWRAALPRDPNAATDAYLARVSPEARQRSDAYFEGGYWLRLVHFAFGLAVSWVLLSSRLLVRVRDAIEARPRLRWLKILLPATVFLVLSTALMLPLDAYQGFYREHLYGLATQAFPSWLGEQALGAAIGALLGALFLWAFYAIVRRAPQTWWLWGSILGVGFLAFVLLISPTYIDPLFNTYRPLADDQVKQPILAMARANGVPADNVQQFDASRQTHRISANVSGIFGTAAIRLNDNLLNRTSPPEIKAVMGHELGHYVLNHAYKMLFAFGVILVFGLAFLKWSLGLALRHCGARFGIRDEADPAGLPLSGLFRVCSSPRLMRRSSGSTRWRPTSSG